MSILAPLGSLFKGISGLIWAGLILFGVVYFYSGFGGIVDSFQENIQQIDYQKNFDKDYKVTEETNEQILTQFYKLTDDQVKSMTKKDKFDYAYKQSYNAQVYSLQFTIKGDTGANLHCVKLTSFEKDGAFREFKLDDKWAKLWAPMSITYDVQYRSNVFDKAEYYKYKDVNGRLEWNVNEFADILPYDYFERHKVSNRVTESELFGVFKGVSQRIDFNDRIQIVLPDIDGDGKIDDRELLLIVRLKTDEVNTEDVAYAKYQVHEIPLEIKNGFASFKNVLEC